MADNAQPTPGALPARVLMTADAVGGVWPYSLELAAGLGARGVSVVLATMGRRPDAGQRRAALANPALTLVESDYPLEWTNHPWAGVAKAGDWLMELERCHQPDLIHLNGYAHGALPWRAPVLVVAHSCVYSWFAAVKGQGPPPPWERYRRAVKAGLGGADWVAAPSSAMLQSLGVFYGEGRRRSVIYNGREIAAQRVARKEPIVFSAGRLWDEAKNIMALAMAARGLKWPVYVAGDRRGPGGETVEFPSLHCLGFTDGETLFRWLGRASVFALPARYEPFGLSALEAALAGCALVLGDIPSLREVWENSAVFVNPNDPDELGRAIDALMRNTRRREEYAMRASRRAREFTPRRMVDAYAALYEKLLRDGRGRSGAGRAAACPRRFCP